MNFHGFSAVHWTDAGLGTNLPGRDFQDGGECCSSVQPAFSRQIVCSSSARGFLCKVICPFYFPPYLKCIEMVIHFRECIGRLCNNNRSHIYRTVIILTKILNLAEVLCCIPRMFLCFSCINLSLYW